MSDLHALSCSKRDSLFIHMSFCFVLDIFWRYRSILFGFTYFLLMLPALVSQSQLNITMDVSFEARAIFYLSKVPQGTEVERRASINYSSKSELFLTLTNSSLKLLKTPLMHTAKFNYSSKK